MLDRWSDVSWNDPDDYYVQKLAGVDIDLNEQISDNLVWLHDGKPGCRKRHNANQNIGDSNPTQLALNTTSFDRAGMAAVTDAIQIPEDAVWLTGGSVHFNSTLGGRREMWIEVAGAGAKVRHLIPATSTTNLDTVIGGSIQIPLSQGDELRLFAYQDSGGTIVSQSASFAFPSMFSVWLAGE